MTRSVRIHEFGGPEVLRIEDVVVGDPGAGEVRLRIHAIGLNRTEIVVTV
jgi:NADPH:quinone reductase-like Zn-dependent oxidoreductase